MHTFVPTEGLSNYIAFTESCQPCLARDTGRCERKGVWWRLRKKCGLRKTRQEAVGNNWNGGERGVGHPLNANQAVDDDGARGERGGQQRGTTSGGQARGSDRVHVVCAKQDRMINGAALRINSKPPPQNPVPHTPIQLPMLGALVAPKPSGQLQQQGPAGPQQQLGPQPSEIPLPPQSGQDYTLSSVLHFLQTEWRRYERDRNEWEIERAEMRVSLFVARCMHPRRDATDAAHAAPTPSAPPRPALHSSRANAARSTMSSWTSCAESRCWSTPSGLNGTRPSSPSPALAPRPDVSRLQLQAAFPVRRASCPAREARHIAVSGRTLVPEG